MARRRSKRKAPTRRRSRRFNVMNAAELYLSTDVLTRNFAGTNPLSFFTGQEMGVTNQTMSGVNQKTGQPFSYSYQTSALGYYPAAASVTLPEILGFGSANVGDGVQALTSNFKANLIPAAIQYAGVKVGFKIASRLLTKQRSFINNQVLPLVGMKSMVRV